MGEEVDKVKLRVVVQILGDDNGALNFNVNTGSPIELWGIAKQLEKMADELAFAQQSKVRQSKPRLVVPGS
jgi:hypothetical protein